MQQELSQVIVEDLSKPQNAPPQAAPEKPQEPEAPQKATEPEKKDEPLSVRFAALAKKEKLLLEKERQLKELENKFKPYELTRENVKKSPKSALESLGMTYEEFTQALLNEIDGKPTITTEDKVEELYKKLAEKERLEKEREEQARKQQEEQAISQFKSNIKEHVKADTDKFEMINLYEAFDEVYDTIEAYFEETGEMLDVDRAAQEVENQLFEEAQKIKKAKKLGFTDKPQETAVTKAQPEASPTLGATLTNKLTPTSVPAESPQPGGRLLSHEESIARAAAMLRFK